MSDEVERKKTREEIWEKIAKKEKKSEAEKATRLVQSHSANTKTPCRRRMRSSPLLPPLFCSPVFFITIVALDTSKICAERRVARHISRQSTANEND